MKKISFLLIFVLCICFYIFPQENNMETLNKYIIIEKYDINIIKNIVKDICIRWDMTDNSNSVLFYNQELLYLKTGEYSQNYVDINLSRYCAVYQMDNKIYIFIHDPTHYPFRSKWFDNFPFYILDELNKNKIVYRED
jgi:hypothetical protein